MHEKKRNALPELLAPAGSFAHLEAAVRAGADAVYMGAQRFGARAYAENFTPEELVCAIRYAHFHARKVYLTVNTLLKEEELAALPEFLRPYYEAGLDGVIVQDFGAAACIREHFPGMAIHGSTQMTVTDGDGARAAAAMGMSRVVPARELSLAEIKQMKRESGLEMEIFIHGALCYCYSGQCLLSSMYGGRSGNRGRCAQPCRLRYAAGDGAYAHLLSLRDLCTLRLLPEILAAGADSLKIEGRMKNVEYVAGVTAIYRKYLDRLAADPEAYRVEETDLHALEELYSRDGFTEGYLRQHDGKKMLSVLHPKNMGRRIGTVASVQKNRIRIRLTAPLHPKDILVIPAGREEVVLTVPASAEQMRDAGEITLNAPRAGRLRTGMPVYRRKNNRLSEKITQKILNYKIKYPVTGRIRLRPGEAVELTLAAEGENICLTGETVQAAKARPLTEATLREQWEKTGDEPFFLSDFSVDLQERAFLPLSTIKSLRRRGYEALKGQLMARGSRTMPSTGVDVEKDSRRGESVSENDAAKRTVLAPEETSASPKEKMPRDLLLTWDETILRKCMETGFYGEILLPADGSFYGRDGISGGRLRALAEEIRADGRAVSLFLPRVMRRAFSDGGERKRFEEICAWDVWEYIYAHNINEAHFLSEQKSRKAPMIASESLYQWNRRSREELNRLFGIRTFTLPVELSSEEWRRSMAGGGAWTYEANVFGRTALMVSAQCIKKTTGRCDHTPGLMRLVDEKRRTLPVSAHCGECYNVIWQDRPLCPALPPEIEKRIKRRRFTLLCEEDRRAAEALLAKKGKDVR